MLNLAPLRYARVMACHGGPVGRLEQVRLNIAGKRLYQVNAYLSPGLGYSGPQIEVFSAAEGTGTDGSPMMARFKAVSEAMERWALYALDGTEEEAAYGLDRDPTSTGMAAFPGLFRGQARSLAMTEAVERYCVVGWWTGGIRAREERPFLDRYRVISLDNPLTRHAVTIAWTRDPGGFHAYGTGAADTGRRARWKAVVELERARHALANFHKGHPGFRAGDLSAVGNMLERRVLYYSLPDGYRDFSDRLDRPPGESIRPPIRPVVDCRLPGPWSRYATVWRLLYDMPSGDYLDPDGLFFYW